MKTILMLAVATALSGCASATWDDGCTRRVVDAHEIRPGQVVLSQHCSAWTFGPSATQRALFEARRE